MSSFFSGWLYSRSGPPLEELSASVHDQETPALNISPPHSSDEDEDELHENDEDDTPPAFPALSSTQRISTPTTPTPTTAVPKILTDTELMPPPPLPSLASRSAGVSLSSGLSSSLALPPSTTKAPPKPAKKSRKVALAPGHGALDWANLKESGEDLRGVDTLCYIPPSELKRHNKRDDAWTAISGKVYNVTAYLPYHPGGEKELMRVAGRDGTKLFASTHGWVNVEFMLDSCLVGFLVTESRDSES